MENTNVRISIKKNDQVEIIAGNDKSKPGKPSVGKVLSVDPRKNTLVIEKKNLVKRHVKASQKNPQGGIIEKEKAIHISNVMLFCGKCNRGVRHRVKKVNEGKKDEKKNRICVRCDSTLDQA